VGLNAGTLDRELWLQQPSGEDGSYENVEADPSWGAVRFAVGNELLRFTTPLATGAFVVTIRYRDDIRGSWRLVMADESPERTLQVTTFGDPDGRKVELQVFCVEVL
jgi:head-tail adaptor